MSNDQDKPTSAGKSIARRDFLLGGSLLGLASGAGLTAAATVPSASAAAKADFPVVDVAKLSDIADGGEISFDYPDADSPAVLVKLDQPAEGGIGPNESIVAYSMLCTHKGCQLNFQKEHGMLICPCHWSSFDPAKGGRIIIGQASDRLPQITLRISDGVVQAVGVNGLIYGRQTNII